MVVETDSHGVVHVKVVECSEEDVTQAALKRPATLSQSEYNLLQGECIRPTVGSCCE